MPKEPATPREEAARRHVECIYYEEQGKLRIAINAGMAFTVSLLQLIDAMLQDASGASLHPSPSRRSTHISRGNT